MFSNLFFTYPQILFSGISLFSCALLLSVLCFRLQRRGALAFAVLLLSIFLWQFGKFIKNLSLVSSLKVDVPFWAELSFIGASLIFASFCHLAFRISFRDRGFIGSIPYFGYAAALLFIYFDQQKLLYTELIATRYGYFKHPTTLYSFYLCIYSLFIGIGTFVLYPRHYRRIPEIRRQATAIFYAAILGYGLGSLEFVSIYTTPLYPLSDLSACVFGGILYWAIFRFNLMGAGEMLRYVGLSLAYFIGLCVAFYGVWFSSLWCLSKLTFDITANSVAMASALQLLVLTPPGIYLQKMVRRRLTPVRYSYRRLLSHLSAKLTSMHSPEEMFTLTLNEMINEFGLDDGRGILFEYRQDEFQREHSRFIGEQKLIGNKTNISLPSIMKAMPTDRLISRRQIFSQLRTSNAKISEKYSALMDLRRLQRLKCDLCLPVCSQGSLIGLLLFNEKQYHAERWEEVSDLMSSLAEMLGNYVHQVILLQHRSSQEHLGRVGMIAATMAHEIKNPLEGIYGSAQVLRDQGHSDMKFVDIILKDSQRLNEVVHQFLQFSRPFQVQMVELELNSLIEAFVITQNSLNQVKPLVIYSTHRIAKAIGDSHAIQQILLNLTQNARRYQPDQIPIQISLGFADSNWEIKVEDKGPGVAFEHRSKLFEPFFTTSNRGTGLGLATSRKIAQEMNGELYYEPGEPGSCFTLSLPRLQRFG